MKNTTLLEEKLSAIASGLPTVSRMAMTTTQLPESITAEFLPELSKDRRFRQLASTVRKTVSDYSSDGREFLIHAAPIHGAA